jgi:D-amino-acid dehydrogenase
VHAGQRAATQRLAQFSRNRMDALTHTLRLDYEQARGLMVLLRGARDLALAQRGLTLLTEFGVPFELLDAARCREIEPGLNPEAPLHAAIHLPQDGVGNCRQFAHLLKHEAQRLGADFRFGREVHRIVPGMQPALVLRRPAERRDGGDTLLEPAEFDAVIVCAGAQANALLGPIGLRLPLAAVHGYSVTAPLRHVDGYPDMGPRAALIDGRHAVAITRLGRRVRVAGGAELGCAPGRFDEATLRTLYKVIDEWIPGAALLPKAQHWKGARPMLPDGPPVLGASGAPGVWINLGHGASGWALACGSAQVMARLVAGHEPELDLTGLGSERLRR